MNMEIGRVLTIDDSLVETQVKVPNIRTYTCNIALEALAEQFLNAPEASLEMRAYLVQTTLPTLVLSLEKLIHEIEQRMLITNNPKEAEQVNYSDSKGDFRASISNSETTLNSPSHSQPDMPVERFDALQWLAQHLFRNNPFYSHCFDQTSSAYVKSMTVVAEGLRQKISDLAASKEAKRISDELARQQEQHRAQLARIERLEETRQIFTSSLGSVFNTWMTSLWREPQGVLSQSELINGFTDVSNNTDIQSTPDLYIKVVNLCKAISTTHNDANIEIPAEHKIFDSTDPLYLLDPADVERWDINLFIKMNLKLMCMWSANELSDFLRALSSTVAAQGTVLTTVYKESLFVPVFKHSEITTVDDWLEELRKVAEPLNLSDHVHGNSACSALKNFCLGEDSPQFRNTADTESISDTNDTIAIAEERFKGFSKGILREFGPDIFRKMMAQLKKEVEEMQKRKEVHLLHVANVLPVPKQNDIDEKEPTAEVKQYTLAQLRECLSQFEDPDGTIQAEYLIKILSAAIEKPDVPGRILTTVSHLRSYAGTLDRVVPDSFVSLVESVCGADVDPLSELTPLLLWALSEARDSSVMTKKPVESRLNIERIAMKEIKNLDLRTDLSISTACNMFIDIMEAAFQKIYPKKKIFGRISLIETAITKLATGLDKLTDGDEISSNGIIESFMRTVAVSQVLWPTLLGRTANEGSGVDYQITTLQNNLIIKDVSKDATVCLDPFVKCSVELLEENLTVGLMGFPIASPDTKPFGALSFLMSDTEIQMQDDAEFVKRAVFLLVNLLALIDGRIKSLEVAKAAMSYLSNRCEADIQIFIVEPSSESNNVEIYQVVNTDVASTLDVSELVEETRSIRASPYMRPWSSKLCNIKAETTHHLSENLVEVCNKKSTIIVPDGKKGYSMIPIFEANGIVVAIISLKSDENTTAVHERVAEISKLCGLMGGAFEKIKKDGFLTLENTSNVHLDASSIDENSRRRFLFGKIVLDHVRTMLLKMDNRALAELRSYKNPPKSIHRIVKGVLYIFGRSPKEVKLWLNTIRLFTMELVKKMIKYDPTAIQKKVFFTRAKRVLKMVSFQDQVSERAGTGSPAQILHDWLTVVLELRDQAVLSRKARPDLFVIAAPDTSAIDDGEEEEEESKMDSIGGSTQGIMQEGISSVDVNNPMRNSEDANEGSFHTIESSVDEAPENGSKLDITARVGQEGESLI